MTGLRSFIDSLDWFDVLLIVIVLALLFVRVDLSVVIR